MDIDPLPWLLNWPPSRRLLLVFFVLSAASLGTIVVLGGMTDTTSEEPITVSNVDLTIRLNDNASVPDTNGSVETCLASGTPGDHLSVLGDVTVSIPAERSDTARAVVVQLNRTGNRTVERIDDRGTVTSDVFWLVEDDETFDVGETATVEIRVRDDDRTVASKTLSVPVENGSRSYDC